MNIYEAFIWGLILHCCLFFISYSERKVKHENEILMYPSPGWHLCQIRRNSPDAFLRFCVHKNRGGQMVRSEKLTPNFQPPDLPQEGRDYIWHFSCSHCYISIKQNFMAQLTYAYLPILKAVTETDITENSEWERRGAMNRLMKMNVWSQKWHVTCYGYHGESSLWQTGCRVNAERSSV